MSGRSDADAPRAMGRPCPLCGGSVEPKGSDRPFCSRRCRMIDLGRWFNEEYAVPGEDAVSFDAPGFLSEGPGDVDEH